MKTLTVAVLGILLAILLLHDVDARGGGGRGRGGGGRGRSRGGGNRGGRGGRTSGGGSKSSKSGITKSTPIKPVKFSSPVIKSQTVSGSRTKLFTRVASGYLVTTYALNKAPVYREGFPVYEKYVSIPDERAVRISSERVSLLNSNGNLCLSENSSVPRSLNDGIEKNLLELKTTVIYKTNPEKVTILYGVNDTVLLDDIKDKNFTVTIRTRYNVTVVRDTDCTQVEKQVNGTMIDLCEFNCNAENKAGLPLGLIINNAVFFGLPLFMFIIFCIGACCQCIK